MNEVEVFIARLQPGWQADVCRELLRIQLSVSEDVDAAIKWRNPYFSVNGKALLKWYIAKEWINIYFFDGIRLNDKAGLFEPSDNKTMLTIKIFRETELNRKAYADLLRQAIDLKRNYHQASSR